MGLLRDSDLTRVTTGHSTLALICRSGSRSDQCRRQRVDQEWRDFVEAQRNQELDTLIGDEGLDEAGTRDLVEGALRDGTLPVTGSALSRVLPPVSRFAPDDVYGETKSRVLARLVAFLERFSGLGSAGSRELSGDR